jgi:HD-GYP domain-containing protein (c-di-GMP phosphodiesterase class II)
MNLFQIVSCLSKAIDLVSPTMVTHHHRVAFLSYTLSQKIGLAKEVQGNIILAGLLHDAGALALDERLNELYFDLKNPHRHSQIGYQLFTEYAPLSKVADMIKHHHVPWKNGNGATFKGQKVSQASHIIHLAERVAVLIDENEEILAQGLVLENLVLKNKGNLFNPEVADAFIELSAKESFWFDMISQTTEWTEPGKALNSETITEQELYTLAKIFNQIIDFRSRFTTTHSTGVAVCGEALAQTMGLKEKTTKKIRIAGHLHDLGKLAVPKKILEKPGKLTTDEFNIIKSHAYYTNTILKGLEGLEEITIWASYHHERLDGKGYPFHIKEERIPLPARIIAVADVFTALTEDRPYRSGMPSQKVLAILRDMTDKGALDLNCVTALADNYQKIDSIRTQAQKEAVKEYEALEGDLS